MIDAAEHAADYLLLVALALLTLSLFAAHIPGVRRLTGAAPLETDDLRSLLTPVPAGPAPEIEAALPAPVPAGELALPSNHTPEKDTLTGESTAADGIDGGDQ